MRFCGLFLCIVILHSLKSSAQLFQYKVEYHSPRYLSSSIPFYYFDYYIKNDSLFQSENYSNQSLGFDQKKYNFICLYIKGVNYASVVLDNDSIVIFDKKNIINIDREKFRIPTFFYYGEVRCKGKVIIDNKEFYSFVTFQKGVDGDANYEVRTSQLISPKSWLPKSINVFVTGGDRLKVILINERHYPKKCVSFKIMGFDF